MSGPNFDSVTSIVQYLLEPIPTPSSVSASNSQTSEAESTASKSVERKRVYRRQAKVKDEFLTPVDADIQILPKGRVRYGPITVNPRKQPSKTLFTGRRSKYEILSADEEEKRRDRRERNRIAALKCREKRETVLNRLEEEHRQELIRNEQLIVFVNQLKKRKENLQKLVEEIQLMQLPNYFICNPIIPYDESTVNSAITNNEELQVENIENQFVHPQAQVVNQMISSEQFLTNSDYLTNEAQSNENILDPYPLLTEEQLFDIRMSSLEKLMSDLKTPTMSLEITNHSGLINTAPGVTCAKEFSSSSDDGSNSATKSKQCVF